MESLYTVRHEAVFSPGRFNPRRVVVFGVGAVGLSTALFLANLGVSQLVVCDHDSVEPENIGPSLYMGSHITMRKVDACAHLIFAKVGTVVEPWHGDVREFKVSAGDVVFLCLDSNDLKKGLLEEWHARSVRKEPVPARVFEGRMSARDFLTHSFDVAQGEHVHTWMRYYLPDADVGPELPGCGAMRVSVGPTATHVAVVLVEQFIQWSMATEEDRARLISQVYYRTDTFTSETAIW